MAQNCCCQFLNVRRGLKGRLSIQTDPANYRTADALIEQARHFDSLAPNLQVKIPATAAGIKAIEEVTSSRCEH